MLNQEPPSPQVQCCQELGNARYAKMDVYFAAGSARVFRCPNIEIGGEGGRGGLALSEDGRLFRRHRNQRFVFLYSNYMMSEGSVAPRRRARLSGGRTQHRARPRKSSGLRGVFAPIR